MRLFLGIIFGALLTIGGVYVADSSADGVEQRPMVNWDVVGQRLSELTSDMQVMWHDFTRQMTTMRVTNAVDARQRVAAIGRFSAYFTGSLHDVYGLV